MVLVRLNSERNLSWNELTILWNDLTMERNDRKSFLACTVEIKLDVVFCCSSYEWPYY